MPRLRASEVAGMLSVSVRAVQTMAKRGELPGAAQIGRLWTFDAAKIKEHIRTLPEQLAERKRAVDGCPPSKRRPPSRSRIAR
jgi:excisionase family DNA binding protein